MGSILLLDLSAAFDMTDHTILVDFLKHYIGIDGTAFNLLQSYLSKRTQCVSIEGVLSEVSELLYGVPQGSVLGLIEFLSPARFEKRKGGIKTGLVRYDWKKAYISESIEHRNLKLKLWSLCKNSISKMLLDFHLAN